MVARRASALPAGREWIYEARLQGQRAIIHKEGTAVRIRARGQPDLISQFPELGRAAASVQAEWAVLDGLIVSEAGTAHFYALDAMRVGDRDLRAVPLSERREQVKQIIANSGLRLIQMLDGPVVSAIRTAQAIGLSGVIAKHVNSAYHSGTAHDEWFEFRFSPVRSVPGVDCDG